MKYLIDSANLEAIQGLLSSYPIFGVTTNPSILAKEGREVKGLLQALRALVGDKSLHVQVLGRTALAMLEDAKAIVDLLGPSTYIKVPVNPEGIKAILALKAQGMKVTATAICAPQQGLMAAVAGADFVVPYVNRIASLGIDSIQVVAELSALLDLNGLESEILIASLKQVQQIHACTLAGASAMTLPPELFAPLVTHHRSESSIDQFIEDFGDLSLY